MSQYKVRIVTPLTIMDYDEAVLTDVKKGGEREDGFLYDFKEKIEGKLTFDKNKYKEFELIDQSQLRYVPMYITVWELCGGFPNQIMYGKLSILESDFDADKCVVKIKVTSDNKYLKYDQHKGDTYNLLYYIDFPYPRVTVKHPSITGAIKNGISVLHALDGLYKKINPFGNVISNFLTNGGHGNYVCGQLVMYQKSDVIRRNVSSLASKMEWTLEKLINNLCQQFNLVWKIDDYGNLVIDDIYYFEYNNISIKDLTVLPYANEIAGKKQWKYLKEKVFKKELYINPNSINKDFVGLPIVYDNALVNSMDKNAEKKITQDFIVDVPFLSTMDPNDESTDYSGTVLIGYHNPSPLFENIIADSTLTVAGTFLDGTVRPNNQLSWAVLHPYRFKDYGRFFSTGKMNGVVTNFTNIMRTKVQGGLIIKLCCGDEFNTTSYFKTQLGVGTLDKYKITFGKRTAEIDVLFEAQDNLSFVLPYLYPYNACMAMGASINSILNGFGVLQSFSPANPNLVVLAETKPTFFGGTVQIFADGNYIYNPPSNVFVGQDFFEFIVTDSTTTYNAVSTATITVQYPNIYVHQVITETQPYIPQLCATKVELFWYKDAAKTQPLNVTGYCFDVYKKDAANLPTGTVAPDGYSQIIFDYYCGTEEYVDVHPTNHYIIV